MYRHSMGQILAFIIKIFENILFKKILNEYTLIWVELLAYHDAAQFSHSIILGKEVIQIRSFFWR